MNQSIKLLYGHLDSPIGILSNEISNLDEDLI